MSYFLEDEKIDMLDQIMEDVNATITEMGMTRFKLLVAAEMYCAAVEKYLEKANPVAVKVWITKAFKEIEESGELEINKDLLDTLINEMLSVIKC